MHLAGLIPATATPFDPTGSPDTEALAAYLARLAGIAGVGGIAVNMDTGEGPALTPDERRLVIETAVGVVDGAVPVVAGVGGTSTHAAVDEARRAAAAGADAIVVFPNLVFRGDPATIVPYHAAVIDAAGLPTVLFQLQPALGGVIFGADVLAELAKLDGVVALKEASFDARVFADTRDLLRSTSVVLLTGNDNFVFESLVLGARGSLIGLGSVLAEAQAAMHMCASAGEFARASALNEDVVAPLADLLFGPPVGRYRARVKSALTHLGEIPRADVRAPLLPLGVDETAAIKAGLDALR